MNVSSQNDVNFDSIPVFEGFSFRCVDEQELLKVAYSITSNAIGTDDINPRFVKLILPYISKTLTRIINSCLTFSIFPNSWKVALVTPIPKKAAPKDPADFRPISVLCYFSKILEKLMEFQIRSYLLVNNLLHHSQSGFRADHSCDTALLKISTDIRLSLDKSYLVPLVLLDFTKAFDSVDHLLLLSKLTNNFKFSKSAIYLIKSFLHNRYQKVKSSNLTSDSRPVTSGVPQGSILGPLLFSLFINDLPTVIRYCLLHLYADDVQIYLECPLGLIDDCICRINEDLLRIGIWAQTNHLLLNPKKSQCIIFHHTRLTYDDFPKVVLGNDVIPFENSVRNLGIFFNSQLSCCSHVSVKLQKIYACLRKLWLYADILSRELKIKLVKSLILPHFSHGCLVYPKPDQKCYKKLEVAYNDCVRFVYSLRRFDHISPFRYSIISCPLKAYLLFRGIIFLHNLYYKGNPEYLVQFLIETKSERHFHFIIPRHCHSIMESSYFVHIIRAWNSLPDEILRTSSHYRFKDLVLNHLSTQS